MPDTLFYYRRAAKVTTPRRVNCDICIDGGKSGGIAAAIQARKLGRSVALLVFGEHLGGLTFGGLGSTDIGNQAAICGLAREFYQAVGRHYGEEIQWTFEPKVVLGIF